MIYETKTSGTIFVILQLWLIYNCKFTKHMLIGNKNGSNQKDRANF